MPIRGVRRREADVAAIFTSRHFRAQVPPRAGSALTPMPPAARDDAAVDAATVWRHDAAHAHAARL